MSTRLNLSLLLVIAITLIHEARCTYKNNPFPFVPSSYPGAGISVSTISSSFKMEINGLATNDKLAYSLSREPCDINGDGTDDLIIYSQGTVILKKIYVIFGSSTGAIQTDLSLLNGINGFRIDVNIDVTYYFYQ
jgi:hypothetical protein